MAAIRRMDMVDLIAFVLIIATAAGVRVWYLNAAANNATTSGPLQVQDEEEPAPAYVDTRGRATGTDLDVLVSNLKDNNQFASRPPFGSKVEETAHIAPGYPYFLSVLDRVSTDADHADQLARWIQASLGAMTAGLYYMIALIAFRSRVVALLAGSFCVVHPFWIVNTAAIADGTLATFLLALALFLGTRAGMAGGALTSLLYGLAMAALALVRAALLPFAFAGLLWFLIRCRGLPRGWLCAILAMLGFVNGLGPWTVRNWQIFHEPIPIVNSSYWHLCIGNNPGATGGPMSEHAMLISLDIESRKQLKELNDLDLERREQFKELGTQRQRYQILAEATLQTLRADPAGCVRRRIQAFLVFIFGQRIVPMQNGRLQGGLLSIQDNLESMPSWMSENLELMFYAATCVVIFLGLLGWRWTYAWRREGRLLALATIFIPLPYILSHAEGLIGPRLPLDGVLLTFSAYALGCLVPGVGTSLFAGPEGVEDEKAASRRLHEDKPYVRL
jgi:hypothetical protein